MSEKTTLYVKNFPRQFTNLDKTEFLQVFGASEVKSLGKNAFVKFTNKFQAADALQKLHQYDVMGKVLSVEYTKTPEENFEISFCKEAEDILENQKRDYENLNEYVKKLYAINSELNFNQPAPPHLKYKYPSVTRDIIDNIGISLETNSKFYTQVLHLMNKMNLPTPFFVDPVLHKIKKNCCDVEVQTDLTLMDEESEMESDDDERKIPNFIPEIRKRKSILPITNPLKKYRSILEAEKNKSQGEDRNKVVVNSNEEVFKESNFIDPEKRKITIQVPMEIISTKIPEEIIVEEEIQLKESKIITEKELNENRLSSNQFKTIPVFKDYQAGAKSNKLYLKNLSKNVVENDLRRIFNFFIKHKTEEIEIKLMKTGRMKRQAFITFSTPYHEEDIEEGKETMVEKALRMTNGFILKDKPIVVMFGKSKVEWGK